MKRVKIGDVQFVDGGVCAVKGFRAGGVHCGLAHKPLADSDVAENVLPNADSKKDLALIVADNDCTACAVYTTNKVKGAPLTVTKNHLKNGIARAVIVNSVNANTCNPDGIEKAEKMCELAGKALNISPEDVIVASTGVIGQILPIEPIENAMPELVESLSYDGNRSAVEAIMTTDTMTKECAVEFRLSSGQTCRIGGMLKGSGMIHPNMATTLTFITTDIAISPQMLQQALSDTVKVTLNRVSVDGDTSTNDMVCVMASGTVGNKTVNSENQDFEIFQNALYNVLVNLARMMARDGEGATKLVECTVTGADSERTAEIVAKSVITSSLVKAMIFGEDANSGRILCAVGYAGADFDMNKVDVTMSSENGSIELCKNGMNLEFSEEKAKEILTPDEIGIIINIGNGGHSACAWGCDLSYDYVRINGDYRS